MQIDKIDKYIEIASLNKNSKYLVIGESHYFDNEKLNITESYEVVANWYDNGEDSFIIENNIDEEHTNWFNTQHIFEQVYYNYVEEKPVEKSKTVIWKFGRALHQAKNPEKSHITKNDIAQEMKFYDFTNYFLRPSFKTGESINVFEIDKNKAWDNLLKIIKSEKYEKIFILSYKVRNMIKKDLDKKGVNNIVYLSNLITEKNGVIRKKVVIIKQS